MSAYYNEIDPYPAQWLRNLIAAGLIAPGDVDERSIVDVRAADLDGYDQCHFFAGIGAWSHALRLARWPDDRPVWTGSCPCQPFSVAGSQRGTADERHLWPVWFDLIRQCRPGVIFGEQVEAAIRHGWLDLVQDDLEGIGYAVGAIGLPAACVGAPHIRQRLWFVADDDDAGRGLERRGELLDRERPALRYDTHRRGADGGMADDDEARGFGVDGCAPRATGHAALSGAACGMDDDDDARLEGHAGHGPGRTGRSQSAGSVAPAGGASCWSDAEWIDCRDGKRRPVEPGTFPLAHGAPARVGRLRAYGNAIVPQVAAEVIRAFMECRP